MKYLFSIGVFLIGILFVSCDEVSTGQSDFLVVSNVDSAAILKNNLAVKIYAEQRDSISLKKAIKFLDEALEIDSTYTLAYENKIHFLCILDREGEALLTINQALAIDSLNPNLLFLRGVFLDKLSYHKDALDSYLLSVQIYDKLIAQQPDDFSLLYNRLFVRLFINDINFENEIISLKNRFQNDPQKVAELESLLSLYKESLLSEEFGNGYNEGAQSLILCG